MSSSSAAVNAGAKVLQERLHELQTRLAATIELINNWKEAGDSSGHVETTSKLIASIKNVIASVQKVDGTIKSDAALRQNLQECLIPLDLLDLLDHGGGLNPDCFSRALLKEALGQLAGLKRRKLALEMLGAAVESGLKKREAQEAKEFLKKERKKNSSTSTTSPESSVKRKRSEEEKSSSKKGGGDDDVKEPPKKKTSISKD